MTKRPYSEHTLPCPAQGWVDGQSGLAHREGDTGAAGPVWSRSVEAGKREGGLVDPKGEGGGLGCRLGPRLNCQGGVSEGWRSGGAGRSQERGVVSGWCVCI